MLGSSVADPSDRQSILVERHPNAVASVRPVHQVRLEICAIARDRASGERDSGAFGDAAENRGGRVRCYGLPQGGRKKISGWSSLSAVAAPEMSDAAPARVRCR